MARSLNSIQAFDLPASIKTGLSVTCNWQAPDDRQLHDIFEPHRDTQFILIILERGSFKIMLDFKEYSIAAPTMLCVLPGQIHQIIEAQEYDLISIDFIPALIASDLQNVLSSCFIHNPVLQNNNAELLQRVITLSRLMLTLYAKQANMYIHQSVHALLISLLTLVAGNDTSLKNTEAKETRAILLEQQFRQLLQIEYKRWKKPAEYAAALSISVSHLNDSVREVSGTSVSAHIQEYVILEAKRLLFFSKLNIKAIGFELGYADPVYFNRLFKKIAGLTPLEFRAKFRD